MEDSEKNSEPDPKLGRPLKPSYPDYVQKLPEEPVIDEESEILCGYSPEQIVPAKTKLQTLSDIIQQMEQDDDMESVQDDENFCGFQQDDLTEAEKKRFKLQQCNEDLNQVNFKKHNVKFSQAIFVDPLPENAEKILENYKQFSNVSVETCVVMQPLVSYYANDDLNNVKFYRHLEESEISTAKYEHIIYHSPWFDMNQVEEISVKRKSLEQIFNQNKLQDCDWVVIDAEGCDAEIILSFDWEKYCVSRIEFEHIHLNHYAKAVNSYLTSMGYSQVPSVDKPDNVAYENFRIIKQKDDKHCIDKMNGFPNIHYISVVDDLDRRDLLHKKFKKYGVDETKLFPHLFERYDDSNHNIILNLMIGNFQLEVGVRLLLI